MTDPAERIAAALERIADALEAPVDNDSKPAKPRITRDVREKAASVAALRLRRIGVYPPRSGGGPWDEGDAKG